MSSVKRNRKINFTEHEVEMMFNSIKKYNDVLFGQVFPKSTLEEKEDAWQKVLDDVNAHSTVKRTLLEIKVKWKNIKQQLNNGKRKALSEEYSIGIQKQKMMPVTINQSNKEISQLSDEESTNFVTLTSQIQLCQKSICRTCLKQATSLKSIFENELNLKLTKLTNVEVCTGDSLPLEICDTCSTQLLQAYNFQVQVQTSDKKLRDQINKHENSSVKIESVKEVISSFQNINSYQTEDTSRNIVENTSKNDVLVKEESIKTIKQDIFDCKICGQLFISKAKLVKHCKSHKGKFICEECGKAFQHYCNLESHLLVHGIGEKKYGCDLCHMKFVSANRLVMHKRKHTGERPLICPVCGKGFAYPRNLSAHYLTHTGETKYECKICNRKFSQSQNLIRHQNVHTGERPYVCTECGLAYTSLGGLKIHTRNHTNERPYSCTLCNKSFTSQASLTSHKRKHSEERTFLCTVCGKSFKTKTELGTHSKCHTGAKPHACEYAGCNKRFRTHSNLSVHRRTHTGEKRYICSICSKAFASTSVLKQHMNIHTGTKSHVCPICGYRFTQGSTLKTHMKIHEMN